jgi:hypothetical protein
MIEYAYRHSGGEVAIVDQCEAALEELSALVKAAQQSVQPTAAGGSDSGENPESGGG